jgi:hypothetical protein
VPEDTPEPARPAAPVTPEVKALDVDGVRAIEIGTVLWTVAFAACLLLHQQLADTGRGWWTWVCAIGALLGLPGLWYVRRRRDAYARARTGST